MKKWILEPGSLANDEEFEIVEPFAWTDCQYGAQAMHSRFLISCVLCSAAAVAQPGSAARPPNILIDADELIASAPVGKRLVIETIAYSVSVPSGQVVIASFLAPGGTSNGAGFSVPIALTPQGTFSALSSFGALSYFAGTHKVKIIVDPRLNTLGIAASSYRSGTAGTERFTRRSSATWMICQRWPRNPAPP